MSVALQRLQRSVPVIAGTCIGLSPRSNKRLVLPRDVGRESANLESLCVNRRAQTLDETRLHEAESLSQANGEVMEAKPVLTHPSRCPD